MPVDTAILSSLEAVRPPKPFVFPLAVLQARFTETGRGHRDRGWCRAIDSSLIATMSNPHLPPEMLDYIVDYLHDELGTLMRCSLVSKSWVPRTRKYLFAEVRFQGEGYLKWRKTFPDPTNSPAHYTRTLKVGCALGVTEESDWIQSFSHVEWLIFDCAPPTALFLVPFHNFAPSLKSLHVGSLDLQYPQTFDFICSLPFLEDLCLVCRDIIIDGDESGAPRDHSTSPALTGAFEVFTFRRVLGRILRPLLDLPGGLHFRKVILTRCGSQDLPYVAELVLMCSDTLEHIHIVGDFDGTRGFISLLDRSFTLHSHPRIKIHPTRSTSPKRLNSRVLHSIVAYRPADRSSRHSKLSHLIIEISNK